MANDSAAANVATTTATSNNWFSNVTSNLLSFIEKGASVYTTLSKRTNGSAETVAASQAAGAAVTATGTTVAETKYIGLTKTEWMIVGGGVALVSILMLARRK